MSFYDEKPYRPKVTGRRVPIEETSFRQLMIRVRGAQRAQPAVRARVATSPTGRLGRRVVIKARYVPVTLDGASAKGTKLHVMYIEREGAGRDGSPGVLYGSATNPEIDRSTVASEPGLDAAVAGEVAGPGGQPTDRNVAPSVSIGDEAAVAAQRPEWGSDPVHRAVLEPLKGERHQFRLIISPEDAGQLNLTEFTRRLMRRVERDIGQPLIWAAANHYNTDDPHVHLIVRGVDQNGKEVRFDRAYISRVWRERAQEIATRELGLRTEFDFQRQLRREINVGRLTSLDRAIGKRATDGVVMPEQLDKFQQARLKVLGSLGLATQLNHRQWRLEEGWQQQLREDGERGDIIKQMHKAMRMETSRYHVVRRFEALPSNPTEDKGAISGRVVAMGLSDRSPDAMYAIVETSRGNGYYVPLWKSEAAEVRRGDVVTLRQLRDTWRKPLDEHLDTFARSSQGIVPVASIREAASHRLRELAAAGIATQVDRDVWTLPNDFRERWQEHVGQRSIKDDPGRTANVLLEHASDRKGKVDLRVLDEAVAKRLLELEELGVAPKTAQGHRLGTDFLKALKRLDDDRPKAHVSMKRQKLSLERQVTYLGPTWLDAVTVSGSSAFAAELLRLQKRRETFLREQGVKPAELNKRERQRVAGQFAKRAGLVASERTQEFRGAVVELYEAPSGNRYAIVQNDTNVIAIRAGQNVRKYVGVEVDVSFGLSEYDGKPKLIVEPVVPGRAPDGERSGPER